MTKYHQKEILIGYKTENFDFLDEYILDFSKNAGNYLENQAYLSKEQFYVLNLKHKKTGVKISVGTTHLFWDPSHEEVKYYQTALMLSYLSQSYQLGDNLIICGDFNSLPASNVVKMMTNKSKPILGNIEEQFRKSCNLSAEQKIYDDFISSHKLELRSAYEADQESQTKRKYSNYTKKVLIHNFSLPNL